MRNLKITNSKSEAMAAKYRNSGEKIEDRLLREGEHTKRKLQKQRDADLENANKKAQWSGKKMKPPRP